MKIRTAVVWILCNALLAVIVSHFSVRSLNPFAVYTGPSGWLAKIFVSLLIVSSAARFATIVSIGSLKIAVRTSTGMDADDVRCNCHGQPLILAMGMYGLPVKCIRCSRWWHRNSFNEDLPMGKVARQFTPCSICRRELAMAELAPFEDERVPR